MKCWHLVAAAALSFAACSLNSAPVPRAGSELDAGASDSAVAADMGRQSALAGSPAGWPVRRRLPPLVRDKKDGGSSDTNGAGGVGASNKPSTPSAQGGATSPADNPGSSTTDPGQVAPGSGGKTPASGSVQGGQDAGGSASGGGAQPSSGPHSTPDAGSSSSGHAGNGKGHGDSDTKGGKSGKDDDADNGRDEHDDGDDGEDDHSGTSGGGTHGSSSGGDSVGAAVSSIADLVLTIVDLSLTGSSPAIQQLVSTILVLSLSPVELAADSLTEVLDALDSTNICHDDPEHCDPLCQDLEKECKVCDQDEECIRHIEETCRVHLPDWCY